MKLDAPLPVGVPLITQVLPTRLIPIGKLPALIEHVIGRVPVVVNVNV